jgi:hypothetical protein
MTKQEFFDDTVIAYLVNDEPFGFDEEERSCEYLTPEGLRCAVGRKIPKEVLAYKIRPHHKGLRATVFAREYPEIWIEYFGFLEPLFASMIQNAHDNAAFSGARHDMHKGMEQIAKDYELDPAILEQSKYKEE